MLDSIPSRVFLPCIGLLAPVHAAVGEVTILESRRVVYVTARIAGYQLVFDNQTLEALGPADLSVAGNSSWLDWSANLESTQESYVSSSSIYAEGYAGAFSNGSRLDSYPFEAMSGSGVRVEFLVSEPTPYEFYARGYVLDPISAPTWTDFTFHLFDAERNLIETFKIHEGTDGIFHEGILYPGEYLLDTYALGVMRAQEDDAAVGEYTFYIAFMPEPSTLLLLGLVFPLITRRRL